MLLREFINVSKDQNGPMQDNRYLSQNDTSVLRRTDIRKTRLTLRMLNNLRKAKESHDEERNEELLTIRKMYSTPSDEQLPM
jgi:hypothetical protein